MPRRTIESMYRNHEPLLLERAWSWAKGTGRDVKDMLGVCHEAFMECVAVFDRKRGAKFSSLLATICNQRLWKYCRKVDVPVQWSDLDGIEETEPDGLEPLHRWEHIRSLFRADTLAMLDVLLRAWPEVLSGAATSSYRSLRRSARLILERAGYDREEVDLFFAEATRILWEVK